MQRLVHLAFLGIRYQLLRQIVALSEEVPSRCQRHSRENEEGRRDRGEVETLDTRRKESKMKGEWKRSEEAKGEERESQ